MKIAACLLYAVLSVWGNSSRAATADGLEGKLAGAWQEGLVKKVRNMSPAQQQMFVGNVMVFNLDHHFVLYPRCGLEAANYKAKKLTSVGGEWSVSGDGTLHLVVTHDGKRAEKAIPISVDGDEMAFGDGPGKPGSFGRYEGPLPPQCPRK
jgi:hypothetical protein